MPKIRLSVLATDMKGKAGGSVFARNSGGVYFRNNPSGTGSKKEVAAIQKQKFGTLSTQWRGLTAEQKLAWKNAVTDYPTTNAFGEPRFPSGYELFMRLNGVLVSAGLPLLNVPGTKRAFPESFDWYDISPEDYCFAPQYQSTFPSFVNPMGNIGLCDSSSDCPEGYTCFNGLCYEKVNHPNLNEPECTTNEDCSAAGLGTGNDVECQGGECVYVGDGTTPVNSNAYGFAASSAFAYNGQWSESDDAGGAHKITFSMRVSPGSDWSKKLQSDEGLVQLLGNASKVGSGLNLYLMGYEPDTALFVMSWGVSSTDVDKPRQTTVFVFPVPIAELGSSFHVSAHLNTGVLSNSTLYFNGVELNKETPNCYADWNLAWYLPYGEVDMATGVCNTTWSTTANMFKFIIGPGYLPNSLPFGFSDVRFFDSDLTDREHVLLSRGYVIGTETIAIPFNTEKDAMSNVAGPTKFTIRATYMQAILIPLGDSTPVVPSNMSIDWMTVKGSPFNPNPAVFYPMVEVYTPDTGLAGFIFDVRTTGPYNDSRSVNHQPVRSVLQMETNAANYAEIGGIMGANYGNFPYESAFSVQGVLIDSGTGDMIEPLGLTPPKKNWTRFKAGAELSGKVN